MCVNGDAFAGQPWVGFGKSEEMRGTTGQRRPAIFVKLSDDLGLLELLRVLDSLFLSFPKNNIFIYLFMYCYKKNVMLLVTKPLKI